MKRIGVFCIVVTLLMLLVTCVKDIKKEGIFSETEITGIVVEKSTNMPLSDIKVKITDGNQIHASFTTGADGVFKMKVKFNEINDNYYLLLDGSPNLPSKQEGLRGMGREIFDYKILVLYDKTDADLLPQVTINGVSNVMSHSATVSGTVSSSGGHVLIERGFCYAIHQSPTLNDSHIAAGSEIGDFSSSLTNLQQNVTYYVRAYATNSLGTAYSTQLSFSTDGLPTVTTNEPTRNGTTVVAGGNVTSDGGDAVIARGICYSRTPFPDLTSAHSHTTNGGGLGSFSSTFSMTSAGVYYIRAYATNANGTSYGEQKTIDHPYYELPTFTFGAQTYRVAPPAPDNMNWNDANNYCNNLTLYGFGDWRLPTQDELIKMSEERVSIGGFGSSGWWWSNITCDSEKHMAVYIGTGGGYSNGYASCDYNSLLTNVRPIRVE